MATFNLRALVQSTVNRCGHPAFALSTRDRLMSQVLTNFVNEPKYYGDTTSEMVELAREVAATDGLFVAKLAVYARTVMNMRSASHVLCVVLVHEVKGEPFVRRAVRRCVVRGDDVTEMLAAYFALFPGEPLPNSLRRGLRDAMNAFGDYAFAKYRMLGRSVTMADAVKLCHPRRREATRACIAGELGHVEGWETELSAHGNTAEVWEHLLAEGRVPYMALLRHLRNMLKAKPRNLDLALDRLTDPRAVANSRQLPFRFWSAYRSVERMASGKVLRALRDAMDLSVLNYPRLPGRTVVAVDVSGSMGGRLSMNSSVTYADVAALLGACTVRLSDDCWLYTFASDAHRVPVVAGASVLETMGRLRGCGGCTNMAAVFEAMARDGVDCDRVVVLSDNEVNYNCSWNENYGKAALQSNMDDYRRRMRHRVWMHAVDMAGYGTTQFDGPYTTFTAGWSEKVLTFITLAEAGVESLETAVESVEL